MTFLESCLHLYFRDFHPSFPVIHKATFQRDRTSPLLLLSMCSIECMFIGTQAARDKGLRIYERLPYVLVNTVSYLPPHMLDLLLRGQVSCLASRYATSLFQHD